GDRGRRDISERESWVDNVRFLLWAGHLPSLNKAAHVVLRLELRCYEIDRGSQKGQVGRGFDRFDAEDLPKRGLFVKHSRTSLDEMNAMLELTNHAFGESRLLMRELSHRVNNEFTSAISLISLAAARSHNSEVKAALHSVGERLRHYAYVHRILQMPERRADIDAASYLRQLCLSIQRSKLDCNNITLSVDAQAVTMQSDRCWRLGMIVYELVTNAARHAFNGAGGEIWVGLWYTAGLVECRVSD